MTSPSLRGERVLLRPAREDDVATLRALLLTPEVARWWGPPWPTFPFEDDPDTTALTIFVVDEIAGLIQTYEEPEPAFRHATTASRSTPR